MGVFLFGALTDTFCKPKFEPWRNEFMECWQCSLAFHCVDNVYLKSIGINDICNWTVCIIYILLLIQIYIYCYQYIYVYILWYTWCVHMQIRQHLQRASVTRPLFSGAQGQDDHRMWRTVPEDQKRGKYHGDRKMGFRMGLDFFRMKWG